MRYGDRMRVLVTIPHFYHPDANSRYGSGQDPAESRLLALRRCVLAWHQHFGPAQRMIQLAEGRTREVNAAISGGLEARVHVVLCTVGEAHLLPRLRLDESLFHHHPTRAQPDRLGFECQKVLRDRWGNYDWHVYCEDDLIVHDPLWFRKLAAFGQFAGADAVLMPHRFERGPTPLVHKAYIDGDLPPEMTAPFQTRTDREVLDVDWFGQPARFVRPLNPHAGVVSLTRDQMSHWMKQPHFLNEDCRFVGPLESAATLGVMRTFRLYKPAIDQAGLFEIEHHGSRSLDKLRPA